MIACSTGCLACNIKGYEAQSVQFLNKHIVPGSVFLDIGAHVGLFSLVMRQEAGRVLAIEAHPAHISTLKQNTARFDNVETVHAAAWEKDGEVMIVERETGQHYVQPGKGCRAIMIDSLLPYYHGSVAIKIDCEGAELQVLKGMDQLLTNCKSAPLVIELDRNHQTRFRSTPDEVHSFLLAKGFKLMNFDPDDLPSKNKLKAHYLKELV